MGVGPRAHQYFGDQDTYDWHPGLDLYGGGGLLANAQDLAEFMRLLLEGKVLKEEASLVAMMEGGTDSYRLGLIRTELGGHEAFGHTGFWNTFAYHIQELDLTLSGCVLSRDTARGQDLAEELVELIGATAGSRE